MTADQQITVAIVSARDYAARALREAMDKFDSGAMSLSAYTAALKQAEELLLQADRLAALTARGE